MQQRTVPPAIALASVLHLQSSSASAGEARAPQLFIDTLPSVGLVALLWHSGSDFTARGVLTAENLDAMTVFF